MARDMTDREQFVSLKIAEAWREWSGEENPESEEFFGHQIGDPLRLRMCSPCLFNCKMAQKFTAYPPRPRSRPGRRRRAGI